jgi:hypothetical protein
MRKGEREMSRIEDISGLGVYDPSRTISFRSPHLILAGCGALKNLGPEAKGMGAQKALIVTDNEGLGVKP